MALSSISLSASWSIRSSAKSFLAFSSSGGRRRLPTWSARKGGVSRLLMATTVHFCREKPSFTVVTKASGPQFSGQLAAVSDRSINRRGNDGRRDFVRREPVVDRILVVT